MKNIIKKNTTINICIVNKKQMKIQNLKYRGIKKTTNILSFPYQPIKQIKTSLIGDLIICKNTIQKEAKIQKKPINMHWAHIIIHGTLHLIGYHHYYPKQRKIMEEIEIQTMMKIGYKNPYII
ncbi:rRNA maturation RNase YbeY [Buchnera aphidicola]|uniref:rRNA maturation RNase YbeY n=1 Tax=Buchnera aphidicola TaxID=9 RepID=UPI0034646CAA